MSSNENIKKFVKEVTNETFNKIDNDLVSPIEQKVGKLELRTHIGKQLDYGEFILSNDISGSVGLKLPLIKSLGNIDIDSNGNILLESYKKYKITISLVGGTRNDIIIYDETNNKNLSNPIVLTGGNYSTSNSKIIETTKNIGISFKINYSEGDSSSSKIYKTHSIVTIEEIGRQVILDPAEEAKTIEFGYGSFVSNNTQIVDNMILPLQKNIGNLELNDNKVKLKANTIYNIMSYISCNGTGAMVYTLKNLTDNKILQYGASMSVTSTQNRGDQSLVIYTIKTTKEIEIGLQVQSFSNITTANIVCLEVRELAQPYYFNYFKDSISSEVLFEGDADAVGNYTLNDNINKYTKLIIYYSLGTNDVCGSRIINVDDIINGRNLFVLDACVTKDYNYGIFVTLKDNQLIIDEIHISGNGWSPPKVYKVEGIGFNYENPYRDLISDTSFSYTEEDIDEIYNELGGN